MLEKQHRLNLREPQNVSLLAKKDALFASTTHLLAFARENSTFLRVNVVVPKRLAKTAVARHFYRRLIFDLIQIQFTQQEHLDIIIMFRSLFPTKPLLSKKTQRQQIYTELELELNQLIKKLASRSYGKKN